MQKVTSPTSATDTGASTAASARGLLVCGVLAGPLFTGAAIAQAATREGFDAVTLPMSMLSLGDLGWIQISNFIICGLLALAGAVGLRRALVDGPASKWGPRLFGIYGIALVWGGVFVADAAFGFPAGTPEGPPESLSWHGILHAFAAPGAGIALFAACLLFARRFARGRQTGWRLTCYAVPVLYLALVAVSFTITDYRWLFAGGAVTWLWAAALSLHVLRSAR